MKGFTYTAIAFAGLTLFSSSLATAGEKDREGDDDHLGNGQRVVMCHQPYSTNRTQILVKVKDIAEHQAQGDVLGSCPVGPVLLVG